LRSQTHSLQTIDSLNLRELHQRLLLTLLVLLSLAIFTTRVNGQDVPSDRDIFIIYASGLDSVCRAATPEERRKIEQFQPKGLRQINHQFDFASSKDLGLAQAPAPHLTIILRATSRLDANAPAKAAFIRAAAAWEAVINSPVTIFIDADFGPTDFDGDPWEVGVLGSTSHPSLRHQSYPTVRNALLAGANSAQKIQTYNALPANTVPTNNGSGSSIEMTVSTSLARAIGLIPPTALASDSAAQIGFNSNVSFDFDPNDGITGNRFDFEAVVTHEIGHALGFTSNSGSGDTAPAMWDLYRFRTGTTTSTFSTALRIMTAGGPAGNTLQFFFAPGLTELGLSTGGPQAAGSDVPGNVAGDGNQSSHWKEASQNGAQGLIGIMDPRIPRNTRRLITANDTSALDIFGYNSTPVPTPLNDNFSLAQVIGGCAGTVNGSNLGASREANEPIHSPDNVSSDRSVWYIWQSPSTGNVTFNTVGSDFDTVMGVYSGTSLGSLITQGQKSDDANPDHTSSVTFSATAGNIYRIAVDGYNNSEAGGDVGSIVLNWTSASCPAGNPIDDAGFFVRQHYLDFLNREPDTDGFNFWRSEITSCGANAQCIEQKRINVSAAFFLAIEFQQTGYFVERAYKTAYGNATGNSTLGGAHTLPVPIVRYNEFQADKQQISDGLVVGAAGWEALLDSRKSLYVTNFVQRSRFTTAFPAGMTPLDFVNALNTNAGNPLSTPERDQLVTELTNGAKTRAQVLRAVVEDADLESAELRRAFVLAQYFGYLRRNPNDTPDSDYTGYDFWLTKLNDFNGNFVNAEMVKAFILSGEYRHRFGP